MRTCPTCGAPKPNDDWDWDKYDHRLVAAAPELLSAEELNAIDIACMHLLEVARRGRRKQQDYISIDNDPVGAEWMATAVQATDAARVTLRALISRAKGGGE